tara:strand:- start:257 stop:1774 length:1518 start_codon:yes stop_codon:yes gene_type:complete
MTDKFNLKKNKQLKNIVRSEEPTSKEEETIINNVNCDHKNGCDHVLTNGINIGWIWNNIDKISENILQTFRKNTAMPSDDLNKSKKKRTNKQQLEELKGMINKYNRIQTTIFIVIFSFIIITIIYKLLKQIDTGNESTDYYFGVTQMCYFIKELFNNEKEYGLTLNIVLGLGFIQFLLFGIGGVVGLLTPFIFIWLGIGNFMFKKKNIKIILITVFSSMFNSIIIKSMLYYKKRLFKNSSEQEREENESKMNDAYKNIGIILVIINIIILGIVCYLVYNDYTINVDSNTIKDYDDLSSFLDSELLTPCKKEQEIIITKINDLLKEFASLDDEKKEQYKLFYNFYIKLLSTNLIGKKEWMQECITYFNTKPFKLNLTFPNISEFVDDKEVYKDMSELFNKSLVATKGVINDKFKLGHILVDYGKGILFRLLEITYQIVVQPFISLCNLLKLVPTFIFDDPTNNGGDIQNLNLINFKNNDLLSILPQKILMAHRRVAKMFKLIIVER